MNQFQNSVTDWHSSCIMTEFSIDYFERGARFKHVFLFFLGDVSEPEQWYSPFTSLTRTYSLASHRFIQCVLYMSCKHHTKRTNFIETYGQCMQLYPFSKTRSVHENILPRRRKKSRLFTTRPSRNVARRLRWRNLPDKRILHSKSLRIDLK